MQDCQGANVLDGCPAEDGRSLLNAMRVQHPSWFIDDLKRMFALLASSAIRSLVAERISMDEVVEAHRRLEAGGLEGKLVLCPDLPSRPDRQVEHGEIMPRNGITEKG